MLRLERCRKPSRLKRRRLKRFQQQRLKQLVMQVRVSWSIVSKKAANCVSASSVQAIIKGCAVNFRRVSAKKVRDTWLTKYAKHAAVFIACWVISESWLN